MFVNIFFKKIMKILKKLRKIEDLTRIELSKQLNIDDRTIIQYEIESKRPWFEFLLRISKFFEFTIDFIINEGKTDYPRNLKLLNLAKEFDKQEMRNQRNQIEANASSFLSKIENNNFHPKIDDFEENLTDDFHKNIKTIRLSKNLSQAGLGKPLGISARSIFGYEHDFYPPIDKFKKISERLNVSAHSLATGYKLHFKFVDNHFGDTMIKADHFLPLEEHKMLIHLMETIIKNSEK